jgi:dipeptidyl-peptidase-4
LIFWNGSLSAQDKLLTTEDVVLKGRTVLSPQRISNLQWIKGTDMYSFTDTTGGEKLWRGSLKNANAVLLSLTELNHAMKMAGHDTLAKFPAFEWRTHHLFQFTSKDTLYHYDLLNKSLSIVFTHPRGKTAEHITPNENNLSVAYTIDNNLYVLHNGNHIAITRDEDANLVNGQAVHREEFGIHEGIYWSPRGNFIAFYRMDQRMVTDYPITEWSEKPASVRNIKYPFAGDSSHHVTVGVYDLNQGTTIYLKTGEPKEQYLTNVTWSPDEKKIYVVIVNRQQNHLWFNRYDAATGNFEKTLFEEHNDRYVQPLNRMVFNPVNSQQFIWQSRRDGWNHLYLYDTNGKLIRQLTQGNWEVTRFEGFNKEGTHAFLTGATTAITRDLYKTEIATGKTKRLTGGMGTHVISGNDSKSLFLDQFTSLTVPRIITVIDAGGSIKKKLLVSANPLNDYKKVSSEIFTIRSHSGYDLYARITRPSQLVSGKKYPAVVYVYNGPGIQLINDQWPAGNELWYYYMAQNDFIVFTIDGRGTPNRGAEFEQATFRQLGIAECEDQMDGVNFLKSLPYIDSTRVGVYGWSYGGFMTATLMTRYPEVFKAGVAGGPVIDWRWYEVMYTERYMDTPQENPSGYEKTNVLNAVKNLKGKLMLIHGTSDDVVVQQHSMMFLKKAIDLGIQVDYFLYPGHEHNVTGKDRIHLLNKISGYFFNNL